MSSLATPPSGWRVKLYQLNDEGQWDDRGTGSISVRMLEDVGSVGVQVASEDGGSDLLSSRILEDREAYSLQGENIITWEERRPPPEPSIDLALSFQENEGCLQIWNQIQEVQGNYSTGGAHPAGGDGELGDDDDDEDGPGGGLYASGAGVVGGLLRHHLAAELRALPEARVSNLAALRDQLTSCAPMHRESYAAMLMDNGGAYLRKLVSLFGDLEDLEDEENLKLMAHVTKACVLLNEGRLLESLLTEPSLFAGVVGAIEYDPVLKQKATWRHFLDHEATFCEAVPMDDEPDLRNKIDLAFRAALLRDAVTRPGMDDNAISALVQYIYFAHSEILTSLHSTGVSYLHKVLAACTSNTGPNNGQTSRSTTKAAGANGESEAPPKPGKGPEPGKARAHALRFLQEMCAMAKAGNVPMHTRDTLFSYLLNEAPLFEALTVALADDSLGARERTAAAEVLAAVVTFDQATAFRLHVLQTGAHPPPPAWAQPPSAGAGTGSGAATATAAMATAPPAEAPAERGAADDDAAAAAFVAALEKSEGESAAADATSSSSLAQSPPLDQPGVPDTSGASSATTALPRPPSSTSLLSLVLFRLAHEEDSGCLLHYNEVLSKCVDTETMDASERDAFLTVFYDHYIHWLVDPLARDFDEESSSSGASSSSTIGVDTATSSAERNADASSVAAGSSSSATAHPSSTTTGAAAAAAPALQLSDAAKASRSHAVDLLAYCVRAHTYRMKFFVLRNNLVGRVLSLLKQPDKFLKLAALRFVRACVGAKDDFLNRHLVKKGHLSPVFALFAANGGRDNLLSSAVIDLVEFVRTENVKSLVEHIVGSFSPSFESVEYVTTFKSLVLRNDQNLEVHDDSSSSGGGGAGGSGGAGGVAEWRKARDAQEEDEAYFDADDDEVLPTGPPLRGGGGGAGGTDQHSPGAEGGAGSGFGGGGPPPSLSAAAAGARSEAYERSTSGATSDGSTTGMCSSGSEAGSDSESESGSLSGAESPPPPTSPNATAAAAFKPVLKLSPAGPPRPSSPPINQQPPKDGLGRMFEMGHRIPTPTLPRTGAAAAGSNVRKIEILLPASGGALEGATSFGGGQSGSLTSGESSSGSGSSSSGVENGAVPGEAAVLGTSAEETSGDPDAKRQKV